MSHIKKHEKNKDFCLVEPLYVENSLLKLTQCYKYIKAPALTYSDIQCLIKKVDGCKTNLDYDQAVIINFS